MALWLCAVTSACCAESTRQKSVIPVWSAEVVNDLGGSRKLGAPFLIDSNRAGILFLDNQRLLVYEVRLDLSHLSSRESPDQSSSFILHSSIIDANSGRVVNNKDWGTRPHESAIYVSSGGILVRKLSRL